MMAMAPSTAAAQSFRCFKPSQIKPNSLLRNYSQASIHLRHRRCHINNHIHLATMSSSSSSSSEMALRPASPGQLNNRAITQWPKVTLYGDLNVRQRLMRPFRNIWLLEEIGLPYKHIPCKPWSKLAKSVHPLGKVPALLVEYNDNINNCAPKGDGNSKDATTSEKFVVLESAAINTFLGDLAREQLSSASNAKSAHNNIMMVPPPATPLRARYDSLVLFVMTEIDSQSLWIHRKHDDLANVFGEAPTAVQEARRQFDNALDVMVDEIITTTEVDNDKENYYLLSTGFSAVDIIFANCCFWAQQIGWLERNIDPEITASVGANEQTDSGGNNDGKKKKLPKALSPVLATYLEQCRSRSSFMKANELRKNQVYEKKERRSSKL